jgi:hypothetical protein
LEGDGGGLRHLRASGRIGERTVAIAAAALRAIPHLLPDIFPLLAPLERPSADRADLGGAINVIGHLLRKLINQH